MSRRRGLASRGRRVAAVVVAAGVAVALANGGAAGKTGATFSSIPLSGVTAVSSGDGFFLALLNDGTVRAFGVNNFGQLGDGNTTNSTTPVEVKGLTGVIAVSAGGFHSLALLSDGEVMAWGNNQVGQLGDGTTSTFSDVPVQVAGLTGVKSISAGTAHSLALLNDGTLRAWGRDTSGELGDGVFAADSASPVTVQGVSGASAISAGGAHSLAVVAGGQVLAWGSNSNGQLGNGNIEVPDSDIPHPVAGVTGATAVSAGNIFSLALLSNGTGVGWGDDSIGELGDGFNPPFYTAAQRIAKLTSATAINASTPVEAEGQQSAGEVGLALLSNHTVDEWGQTKRLNEAPALVPKITNVAQISSNLFLLTNGTVVKFTP